MFLRTLTQQSVLPRKVTKNFSFLPLPKQTFLHISDFFHYCTQKKGKDMKTNMSPAKKTPPFPT